MTGPGSLERRAGGILLHPTSLPGRDGIGNLGPAARSWIDWLRRSGCMLWQFLPLGPTGYGDSPYQGLSAFAGNPVLVSLEDLVEDGLLQLSELEPLADLPLDRVDFGAVNERKAAALATAADRFAGGAAGHLRPDVEVFFQQARPWLEEFALFMAIKEVHGGVAWTEWDRELAGRKPAALARAREALARQVFHHKFSQFLFFRQWARVRRLAEAAGITLIGDLPIFVAHDSADVWAEPHLFLLDDNGMPEVVAGVPPDYFSPTGQLWGNPLYRWDTMRSQGYAWWARRMRSTLELVHKVRLDHFRGFAAYWEIPAEAKTAAEGRWVPGPGEHLLQALRSELGDLPILAEDLGVITPEVTALRDAFGLPGMKVLQFAFDGDSTHEYLPHNFTPNCVVYTGTHDNDTTGGWYAALNEARRDFCRRYLPSDGTHIAWDLLRAAWASVARYAVAPLQDALELGTEARMNVPGRPDGNWRWRTAGECLTEELAAHLMEVNRLYGRA